MTTKEINHLPAGPELDAMVAEKVMGWRRQELEYGTYWDDADGMYVGGGTYNPVPKYSTDVAAAFGMIQSMREDDRVPYIEILPMRGGRCEVRNADGEFVNASEGAFSVEADTAPLAMCRFALKAVTP